MMPGMRGMNPKQMQMAMKKMGITQEEIKDVQEVVITTASKTYVIPKAEVTMMTIQGQKTFQIMGEPDIIEGARTASASAEAEPAGMAIPEEDIALVAAQANVSPEEARKALEDCNGEPAEAIIKLMS